jgi:class 3 adenylate cyclase
LFLNSALYAADITTDKDGDGILRRAQAFRFFRKWHPAFLKVEADPQYDVDLAKARIENSQIILPRSSLEDIKVPLDSDGTFDLADFFGDALPPGSPKRAKPFTEERIWHMGIVLGAQELKLDLANAAIDLPHGRITLRGPSGVERVIPTDAQGYFYIDWCIPPEHRQLTRESIQDLLLQNKNRLDGNLSEVTNRWRGKLAVVGSSAVIGNNLTDRGATPLLKDTLLVSKHWNVANSIITGRFVQRAPLWVEMALIISMGILAAMLTWELRILLSSVLVVLAMVAYTAVGIIVYVKTRYWMPLVLPVLGGMFMNYVCLVTWRVVFEEADKRRVKSIFSKVVSPKIMNELLTVESLSLVGARREITVMFADVRGFTELTDTSQERVVQFVRQNKLTGEAAEACFEEQARETLETVNLYLGLVADVIIKHDATLDKFIGDCVMAFWGAPTANPRHALACVRAAIETQRAIFELNEQRTLQNHQRELENQARQSAGLPLRPLLPILLLGSGINTGSATAGLMGSQAQTANYTVFGREVNLASRLESASGRGRIFIGETTYEHILRDDPALASTCIALPPIKVKGIGSAVKVYEVPWRPPGAPLPETVPSKATSTDSTNLAASSTSP